jgi:hypothetical protein
MNYLEPLRCPHTLECPARTPLLHAHGETADSLPELKKVSCSRRPASNRQFFNARGPRPFISSSSSDLESSESSGVAEGVFPLDPDSVLIKAREHVYLKAADVVSDVLANSHSHKNGLTNGVSNGRSDHEGEVVVAKCKKPSDDRLESSAERVNVQTTVI